MRHDWCCLKLQYMVQKSQLCKLITWICRVKVDALKHYLTATQLYVGPGNVEQTRNSSHFVGGGKDDQTKGGPVFQSVYQWMYIAPLMTGFSKRLLGLRDKLELCSDKHEYQKLTFAFCVTLSIASTTVMAQKFHSTNNRVVAESGNSMNNFNNHSVLQIGNIAAHLSNIPLILLPQLNSSPIF